MVNWDGESGHHVEFVVPGDFDGDGTCGGADFLAWQRGESPIPMSQSDLDQWQANFGAPVSGDFDGDNDVDGADFLAWQRGELSDPLSSSDLASWQAQFGTIASSASQGAAIPEPSCLLLMLAALAGSLSWRRPT